MKLKVCGMRDNAEAVGALQPEYMGFIFWEPSSRFFDGTLPQLPEGIQKIGVFVDESIPVVIHTLMKYQLDGVQLHGAESPAYCKTLKETILEKPIANDKLERITFDIIKVFSLKDAFDFSILQDYEEVCDYYLFDTKGKLPGGNGYTFDWSILKNYPSTKPYFLSGGIGLESSEDLLRFLDSPASKHCYAIDVNSKFEERPGLKKIKALKEFKHTLIESL